jgi:hypothetical protein
MVQKAAEITSDPEQQGRILGYSLLGEGMAHLLPDISDTARNAVGDSLFIRDPNVSRTVKTNAAPINYGTRPDLDSKSLDAINSKDAYGNNVYSDAQSQTFITPASPPRVLWRSICSTLRITKLNWRT